MLQKIKTMLHTRNAIRAKPLIFAASMTSIYSHERYRRDH